jgi:hypothetical protein
MILNTIPTHQGSFSKNKVCDLCNMKIEKNDEEDMIILNIILFLLINEMKNLDGKISSLQE